MPSFVEICPVVPEKKNFKGFLPYMGMAAISSEFMCLAQGHNMVPGGVRTQDLSILSLMFNHQATDSPFHVLISNGLISLQ